ncbi:MAG: hypothetical protein P4M13_00575 [Alphaproteobacteria bacterium]|nr:hypothetical protein [Alphaproteobacteria bacterium]
MQNTTKTNDGKSFKETFQELLTNRTIPEPSRKDVEAYATLRIKKILKQEFQKKFSTILQKPAGTRSREETYQLERAGGELFNKIYGNKRKDFLQQIEDEVQTIMEKPDEIRSVQQWKAGLSWEKQKIAAQKERKAERALRYQPGFKGSYNCG